MVYTHPRMLEESLYIEKHGRTTNVSSVCLWDYAVYSSNMIIFTRTHITLCTENQTSDQKEAEDEGVLVLRMVGQPSSFSQTLEGKDHLRRCWVVSGPLGYTAHQLSTGEGPVSWPN